jgi:hypothetical protein
VHVHDPADYFQWETINFSRLAHARLLYAFMETPKAKRYMDDVLAEDFDYPARAIPLPKADRLRWNKDLLHLSYSRLRRTPATKPWPSSILANLVDPVIDFMEHVKGDQDLFLTADDLSMWTSLVLELKSGRQMIIRPKVTGQGHVTYLVGPGPALLNGKPALTDFVVPPV